MTDLLPHLLFKLAVGAAILLLLLVFCAPWLDDGAPNTHEALALFARDAALRRTSVASAVGLLVTACVFFRRPVRRSYPLSAVPPCSTGSSKDSPPSTSSSPPW